MKRIPSAVRGIFFGPVLISLFFILKAFCPQGTGDMCFADQFAVPIFLPLIAIYKIFGNSSVIWGHEFLFIIFYWAAVGFVIGLIIDLWSHKEKSAPSTDTPAREETLSKAIAPTPQPLTPPPSTPILKPIISMPKAPEPLEKKVINLLDRPEYK